MPHLLAYVDKFAHARTRDEAKQEMRKTQARWVAFRDSACAAEAAMMFLRSARTREGYTSQCLHQMTAQRLKELKERFPLAKP